jgi:hypothetical protein
MTFFSPGECRVCGIPPLLYVTNSLDNQVILYCYDCGGAGHPTAATLRMAIRPST